MAFPTSPTDGQQTTVNNIVYSYSSANTTWNRVTTNINSVIVPGFDKANNAGSFANGAFTAANTNTSLATAAFGQANTAWTLANAAFTKANTGGGGITYTASNTAPTLPKVGDQWYKINQDIVFEYTYDGTSNNWVDTTTQTSSSGSSTNSARVVGYNLVFGA